VTGVVRRNYLDLLERCARTSDFLDGDILRVVPSYRSCLDISDRIHRILVHGVEDV